MEAALDVLQHGQSKPYTIYDILELNDAPWPRFEVLDGMLLVSPGPSNHHQRFCANLGMLLASVTTPGVQVLPGFNLRLHEDENGLIPDLMVTRPDIDTSRRLFYEAEELQATIEIVSPSNRKQDRKTKPEAYADARIPYYWRVELDPFPGQGNDRLPVVLIHELYDDTYAEVERISAGKTGTVSRPFPLEFDPAELLSIDWPRRFYGG